MMQPYLTKEEKDKQIAALQNVIDQIDEQLKHKDKCAYMGPMRDCPTHGEGGKLKALHSLCRQLHESKTSMNQQEWTATIQALEEIGAEIAALERPNAALSGAEPALSAERPLEGTVRGENPGDETT